MAPTTTTDNTKQIHGTPCLSLTSHKEDFSRRCEDHKKDIEKHREDIEDLKTKQAGILSINMAVQQLKESISEIKNSVKTIKEEQLTEDHIELMMVKFNKDHPNNSEIDLRIKNAISEAVLKQDEKINRKLWKIIGLSFTASGILLTGSFYLFRIISTLLIR